MLSNDLLDELQRLDRADKLRAVQFLVEALALEENDHLVPTREYEVWSPYDAPAAATALLQMLEDGEKSASA